MLCKRPVSALRKFDETNQILADDIKQLAEAVEKLTEEKHALDEKVAEGRQRNDHLEQLGSEARDKLLVINNEINALTNKSQLDAERLNTLDRDFARVNEEIPEFFLKILTNIIKKRKNGLKNGTRRVLKLVSATRKNVMLRKKKRRRKVTDK